MKWTVDCTKMKRKEVPMFKKKTKNLTILLEVEKTRKNQTQSTRTIAQTHTSKITPPTKQKTGHMHNKRKVLPFFYNVSFLRPEGI